MGIYSLTVQDSKSKLKVSTGPCPLKPVGKDPSCLSRRLGPGHPCCALAVPLSPRGLLPVSLCVNILPLIMTPVMMDQGHLMTHPNQIPSAKTLFLNEVTFPGAGVRTSTELFGGHDPTIQTPSVVSTALRGLCVSQGGSAALVTGQHLSQTPHPS